MILNDYINFTYYTVIYSQMLCILHSNVNNYFNTTGFRNLHKILVKSIKHVRYVFVWNVTKPSHHISYHNILYFLQWRTTNKHCGENYYRSWHQQWPDDWIWWILPCIGANRRRTEDVHSIPQLTSELMNRICQVCLDCHTGDHHLCVTY